jgi:hypothetical protein
MYGYGVNLAGFMGWRFAAAGYLVQGKGKTRRRWLRS